MGHLVFGGGGDHIMPFFIKSCMNNKFVIGGRAFARPIFDSFDSLTVIFTTVGILAAWGRQILDKGTSGKVTEV